MFFAEKTMRTKLFALISAAAIGLFALLGGCSCSGDNVLSFSDVSPNTEKLCYTVEYVEDYNESTKKDVNLNNLFTVEYTNGSYVSELSSATVDSVTGNSDILDIKDTKGEPFIERVYLLTTEFKIDLKITIGENEYNRTEKITTKAYIASAGVSFAPLYACEDAEYLIISAGAEKVETAVVKSYTETFYDKDEFRSVKTAKTFNVTDAKESMSLDGETPQEKTVKYDFRTAIDNAELLFAIRGVAVAENASATVNVISPAYDSPTPVRITNSGTAEKSFSLNYNGETVTSNVKYNQLSFAINSTNASGAPQYANVQTEAAGVIKNNALLLEYVKPLFVYGSYMKMGALKFTLNDVTIG